MISLFEQNRVAYEAAVSMLAETGKAAVVHPTGTGKSFIGFKLCEDNPEKKVLWLSPSEYIFRTQLENLRATGAEAPGNITFCTYAKNCGASETEIQALRPDFIILDEFHRCGAEAWGRGVNRVLEAFPSAPVLGLSATAIRYLDNQRDMAEELFDGCIASEMTLGEAIVRGILNPPRYVTTVYAYQQDLERYQRRVRRLRSCVQRDSAERYLEALRRALDKADGLDVVFQKHMTDRCGKYIVFCAGKEHMDGMMEKTREWFRLVDEHPRVYSVYSDDPLASKSFDAFKNDDRSDHLRLLYCIDALNEGIHVEKISGVILLRPTVSPIIYKQQIGRALSASKSTDAVIFDVVMNIENLCSIDTVREEMRVALTYYRSLGEKEIVNERFTVLDEARDCRELFARLNDALTASWDAMYAEAKKYYEAYGDLDVPKRYTTAEGYSLGTWVDTQRRVYRGEVIGVLGEDRIDRLNRIGMEWDSLSEQGWKKKYGAAEAYRRTHGDLNVPAHYVTEDGVALGQWLVNLRVARKMGRNSGHLTAEKIQALDELGMIWNVPDYQWEQNYNAAMQYHRIHGDLNVPVGYVTGDGIRLGMWLNRLRIARMAKDQNVLSDDRIRKLDELGMPWMGSFARKWEFGYGKAQEYFEAHGDLKVAASYVTDDGFALGSWLANHREKYRAGKMPEERCRQLSAIGMVWQKADPWETRFALVEKYYREHGDLNIPAKYTENGMNLAKWLNEQKHAYRGERKKSLTQEQIRKLEALGMKWGSRNMNAVDFPKKGRVAF